MRPPIILLAVILSLLTHHALAETITRCGASKGTAYYFQSPLVPKAETGWQEDKISRGEIVLIMNGDAPDIISTDATGRTFSARGDGATVVEMKGLYEGFRLILVVYPTGVVGHYIFRLDPRGVGKVVWGSAKVGTLIPKSSLMEASCHQP